MAEREGDRRPVRITTRDPANNMYGCPPCPQCGSAYRAPYGSVTAKVLSVECDDCGYKEPGVYDDGR